MDRLKNGTAWVVFNFKDGSKRTVFTTLSQDILLDKGITMKKGFLYDLEHNSYVRLRNDAESIDIFEEKPEYDVEVLRFASKYI